MRITYPQGGSTRIEYKQTPPYRYGSALKNSALSMVLDTVSKITNDDANGNSSIEQYEYRGGTYYYNGPFDRRPAGFATSTKTDAAGDVTNTYFHQGNGSQTGLGEYQDSVYKIGKPYGVETYDPLGHLYDLTINEWDKYDTSASSSFVKLARTTDLTYDGDATHREKSGENLYDNTNGNLTNKTEWVEVTGSTDGSFDIGTDKRTTDITYAASSTGWLFAPKQETVKNESGTVINDTKYY